MKALTTIWRSFWSHERTSLSAKATLSFGLVALFSAQGDRADWLSGPLLGIIAAALADVEDSPRGRLRAASVTLLAFCVVSFAVRLSFPVPWLFAPGLAGTALAFSLLGAVSERYERVVTASLILGIYTTLRLTQSPDLGPWWRHPLELLTGASLYFSVSVAWAFSFALRPARQALALVYRRLGRCLRLKAELLSPAAGRERAQVELLLTNENGRLVAALNQTRQLLLTWRRGSRLDPKAALHSRLYFLSQELHERISSTHQGYASLAQALARSDVLFRSAHLAELLARGCLDLGSAISLDHPFDLGARPRVALEELRASAKHVRAHLGPTQRDLGETIDDLVDNLSTIHEELRLAMTGELDTFPRDAALRDDSPSSFREAWARVRMQLTPSSARFRHGVRLSLALLVAYSSIQLLPLTRGYWVLMTAVFILQRTYSGTWKRLAQRVLGTFLGLVVAWAVLVLQLARGVELGLVVATGVAFLAYRAVHYTRATAAITVFVFLSLDQTGSSQTLLLPRLVDTLVGAMIAAAAIAFVLPDWQSKRLYLLAGRSLNKTALYLCAVVDQYETGREDHLPYRIARRDAHNAHVELSSTMAAMLSEPDQHRLDPTDSFRFLALSHRLLASVSALGAHRDQRLGDDAVATARGRAEAVAEQLNSVAVLVHERGRAALAAQPDEAARGSGPTPTSKPQSERKLAPEAVWEGPAARAVERQLGLIEAQLPELHSLARRLWS